MKTWVRPRHWLLLPLTSRPGVLCGVRQERHQHEQASDDLTGGKIPRLRHADAAPHQGLCFCCRKGNWTGSSEPHVCVWGQCHCSKVTTPLLFLHFYNWYVSLYTVLFKVLLYNEYLKTTWTTDFPRGCDWLHQTRQGDKWYLYYVNKNIFKPLIKYLCCCPFDFQSLWMVWFPSQLQYVERCLL